MLCTHNHHQCQLTDITGTAEAQQPQVRKKKWKCISINLKRDIRKITHRGIIPLYTPLLYWFSINKWKSVTCWFQCGEQTDASSTQCQICSIYMQMSGIVTETKALNQENGGASVHWCVTRGFSEYATESQDLHECTWHSKTPGIYFSSKTSIGSWTLCSWSQSLHRYEVREHHS